MFKHLMVPIDLAEVDSLTTAIGVAVDLAAHYHARLTLVSVSGGVNARLSHNSAEYGRNLQAFADSLPAPEGVRVETLNLLAADPSVEVGSKLLTAIQTLGADLAIIGSHRPGWTDWIINSHGGRLAAHAPISVMVVRDA